MAEHFKRTDELAQHVILVKKLHSMTKFWQKRMDDEHHCKKSEETNYIKKWIDFSGDATVNCSFLLTSWSHILEAY